VIVALDGNTVRGARTKDGKAPHPLAAMICGARAVLAQKDVEQKPMRSARSSRCWTALVLPGRWSLPMPCTCRSRPPGTLVEDKKAGYLFTAVKDNQPSLFAALEALDWQNPPVTHVMRDRGHIRDETRTLQVLAASEDVGFPHAAAEVGKWHGRLVSMPSVSGWALRSSTSRTTPVPAQSFVSMPSVSGWVLRCTASSSS
jgi:hypothetical protein